MQLVAIIQYLQYTVSIFKIFKACSKFSCSHGDMFDLLLRTPMHAAAVRGRAEIMQLLLSTGVLGLEFGTGAESYLKRVAISVRETPEGAWDMSEEDNI
jgi:hypothetical protein